MGVSSLHSRCFVSFRGRTRVKIKTFPPPPACFVNIRVLFNSCMVTERTWRTRGHPQVTSFFPILCMTLLFSTLRAMSIWYKAVLFHRVTSVQTCRICQGKTRKSYAFQIRYTSRIRCIAALCARIPKVDSGEMTYFQVAFWNISPFCTYFVSFSSEYWYFEGLEKPRLVIWREYSENGKCGVIPKGS